MRRIRSIALFAVLASLPLVGPAAAQSDPLSRFIDGLLKPEQKPAEKPAPPPATKKPKAAAKTNATAAKPASVAEKPARPAPAVKPVAVGSSAPSEAKPATKPAPAAVAAEKPAPKPAPAKPVAAKPVPVASAIPMPLPRAAAPAATALPVQPAAASVPATPQAAIERLNGFFNGLDQLNASFTQTSPSGRTSGTLALKRPGQLHFAYAPPSTLEIVSDGRSVAVRDKKLGTNDVYPVGQTPLKFLLKEDFDLGRDTKVRNVQTSPDGLVTVSFEDSATFGGTSKITLRFDARTNTLKQWTVLDPQGFETTVVLSDVQVVRRQSAGIN